ncbi:MAG: C-type lectin domain-containing protein [Deltaproteobacteria bacterium]|nr:C-type lectin domain-containing protein [Deltaproteobacteria bacterium]
MSRRLVVLVVVVAVVAVVVGGVAACGRSGFEPVADAALACPADYVATAGGCYRAVINENELAWLAAELACEAAGPGAHLVVIETEAERAAVNALIPSGIVDVSIGTSDRVTEGGFLTVHGTVERGPWAPGQPDGGALQNCVVLNQAGELDDGFCGNPEDYVCEYDGIVVDPTAF